MPTQVPMSIEIDPDSPDEALPYVDVIVGGRPIRALLDTGSARTTVCPPAGCVIETRPAEGTGVFGGLAVNRRVWRTTVEFGDRPPCPIELDVRSATEGRDLLGQDVLSQFRCEYRFAQSVLRLNGSVAQRPERVFLDRGHHVYLAVEWDGATAEAVFDTGASLSVVDSSFIRSHPHLFAAQGQSEGTDASGATLVTPMVQMAEPLVLGHRFSSTTAAVVDLGQVNASLERPMDIILGWPVLRQANWFIDHASSVAALVD